MFSVANRLYVNLDYKCMLQLFIYHFLFLAGPYECLEGGDKKKFCATR